MVVRARHGVLPLALLAYASCNPPFYRSPAFFANTTRQPVNVRLSRLEAELDCYDLRGRSGGLLARSAFVPEATYRVESGQALPLGPLREDGVDIEEPCGGAMLQILGQEDLAVFWATTGVESEKLADLKDRDFREHAVRLEGMKGLQRLVVGNDLEGSEPVRVQSGGTEPPRPFGWSGQAVGGTKVIGRIDVLPDGCIAVGDTAGSAGLTLYLCVPDWAFPFQVGDAISAVQTRNVPTTSDAGTPPSVRHLLVQGPGANPTRLEIWLDAFYDAVPADIQRTEEPGHFTDCGAYVEPIAVKVRDVPSTTGPLPTGGLDDVSAGGVRTRVLVGRAEHVVVAPDGCRDQAYDYNHYVEGEVHDFYDLLILRTPEGTP